ncbi:hypothetical protein FRC20_002699 [Serendipita sp. 405]|nr:hypothetical protein FRC15_003684 [Serendipita sp. 397]KAG8800930.1 hypothetical protein FRC16_001720 [Serendipita sp. 398]KAG8868837.1 hypothetical protein FRC20_002699 [Serendipita sp. 405]
MDTLLVFAGLFSAVVTAFIIQIQQLLNKAPQDRTNELISIVIQQLNSSNYKPDIADNFRESGTAVAANLLFFCSLSVALFAALAAILVKQSILSYEHRSKEGSSIQAKARARYRAWNALEGAHLLGLISAVPMLLHAGLFLFFAGLIAWLFRFVSRPIFGATLGLTGVTFLLYLVVGIVRSFEDGSPFQWPLVGFLRKVLGRKSSLPNSPFPQNLSNSASAALVAEDLDNASGIKLLPFHQDDVTIVCNAMESSMSPSDIARAIMQLRNLMLVPNFDPEIAFGENNEPSSGPNRRLMALQRCASLAPACIVETTFLPWLKPDAADQARAVCNFLEAYLQLRFSGSDYYNILRTAKITALAEALLEFSLNQPDGRPGDVVVAMSVIAKMSHNVEGYRTRCRQCFRFDPLPEEFLFGVNGIMKRDETEAKQLAGGGTVGGTKAITVHRYLRIFIVTLTDCLLHHYRPVRSRDWTMVEECYQDYIKAALAQLKNDSGELSMLRNYLDKEKGGVSPDSREAKWIEAVYPITYVAPILDTESLSSSNESMSITATRNQPIAATPNLVHYNALTASGTSSSRDIHGVGIV